MSFANKGRDSKDVAKLRAEYQDKARQMQETSDPATRAKMVDAKAKAFERVKEQIVGERRENLSTVHKVLIQQGKLKTREQMAQERAAAKAGK